MEKNYTNDVEKKSAVVKIDEESIPEEKKLAKKPLVILGVFFCVAVLVCLCLVYRRAFGTSKKVIPLSQYFDAQENTCSIVYQNELQKEKAYVVDGYYFLPYTVVNMVDDFYYYDVVSSEILYAKPRELMHYTVEQIKKISDASPQMAAFLYDHQVYINASIFEEVSYVVCELFKDPDRLLIWDDINQSVAMATVKKETCIRTDASKRGNILLELSKADKVYVLDNPDDFDDGAWTKVLSQNGVCGYVLSSFLEREEKVVHKLSREPYEYTANLYDEQICLVWHQIFESTAPTQVERFSNAIDKTKGVNVICPTWFSIISADGTIASNADPEYTKVAHEKGLKVWGLIDNFNKEVDNLSLLKGYPYRQKLISMLMEEAKRLDLDGINIDFEGNSSGYGGLSLACGPHFIQFLRELSIECRKESLVLSVDNHVPMEYNQYFRRDKQAQVVDYVIVMGYDEHYGGGEPGSTASLPFVKSGIEKTLEQVPKNKVINAVPFYTRVWKETAEGITSSAKGEKALVNLLAEVIHTKEWLEKEEQYYTEYESEGEKYRVWIEDTSSMKKRMELIATYDLAGIACWKLGLESEEMWDVIAPYFK